MMRARRNDPIRAISCALFPRERFRKACLKARAATSTKLETSWLARSQRASSLKRAPRPPLVEAFSNKWSKARFFRCVRRNFLLSLGAQPILRAVRLVVVSNAGHSRAVVAVPVDLGVGPAAACRVLPLQRHDGENCSWQHRAAWYRKRW